MTDFSSWWETKEILEKIYWGIAIPFSLIFLIQVALTFIAGDVDGDMGDADADVEGDSGIGFQFITIKNLTGFFTIFGWSGLAALDVGSSNTIAIVISLGCGLLMMTVMAAIFYFMSKLAGSGTLNMSNAINQLGETYLKIPGNRGGFGKVQIKIQGSLRELDAMTDDHEDITSGNIVQVLEIINDQILLVTKSKPSS